MSTKKLLANEARKMVTVKNENQEDQHLIENLVKGFYNLFGIETLSNEQFHQALKEGRGDFIKT